MCTNALVVVVHDVSAMRRVLFSHRSMWWRSFFTPLEVASTRGGLFDVVALEDRRASRRSLFLWMVFKRRGVVNLDNNSLDFAKLPPSSNPLGRTAHDDEEGILNLYLAPGSAGAVALHIAL